MARSHRSRTTAAALLGSLEHQAMAALWADAPATVGQVLDRINEQRPPGDRLAYTTVMTVLGRLYDKGLLAREMVGRGYSYRPRFTEPELVQHLGEREVTDLVERYGTVALTQFAAALQDADPELLARVTRLAQQSEHEEGK